MCKCHKLPTATQFTKPEPAGAVLASTFSTFEKQAQTGTQRCLRSPWEAISKDTMTSVTECQIFGTFKEFKLKLIVKYRFSYYYRIISLLIA